MQRVALVAPRDALRDLLVAVADVGTVELTTAPRPARRRPRRRRRIGCIGCRAPVSPRRSQSVSRILMPGSGRVVSI